MIEVRGVTLAGPCGSIFRSHRHLGEGAIPPVPSSPFDGSPLPRDHQQDVRGFLPLLAQTRHGSVQNGWLMDLESPIASVNHLPFGGWSAMALIVSKIACELTTIARPNRLRMWPRW